MRLHSRGCARGRGEVLWSPCPTAARAFGAVASGSGSEQLCHGSELGRNRALEQSLSPWRALGPGLHLSLLFPRTHSWWHQEGWVPLLPVLPGWAPWECAACRMLQVLHPQAERDSYQTFPDLRDTSRMAAWQGERAQATLLCCKGGRVTSSG